MAITVTTWDDQTADSELALAITAARQQWERDTQEHYITRSMRLTLDELDEFRFPHRPVTAIASVKYYDLDNVHPSEWRRCGIGISADGRLGKSDLGCCRCTSGNNCGWWK